MFAWFVHAADWFALKGRGYQFWSGIGSGSPLIAGVFIFWRKHNCHVKGCPRLIWKTHNGDALCRVHHPQDPPTAEEIS